jgi:hypothetical protein
MISSVLGLEKGRNVRNHPSDENKEALGYFEFSTILPDVFILL